MTDYADIIAGGDYGAPQPVKPTWALPADPPIAVAPGIKRRFREIAAFIKAQKSIYTPSDGELLGIFSPNEAGLSPDTTVPELKLHPMPNFALEADFRKYDLDALRVEFRHKGGAWQLAAILTSSSGVFNVVPNDPGNAEQIEIRAIFIEKNQPYGIFLPI